MGAAELEDLFIRPRLEELLAPAGRAEKERKVFSSLDRATGLSPCTVGHG